MTFADDLRGTGFPVALEITPPKRTLSRVLLRRARLLGDEVAAVNVIQRPDRQPSLDASIELQAAGFEPVWHLVIRGQSREVLDAEIRRAADAGIRNVLCIRGDNPPDGPPGPTIKAMVSAACKGIPGALVGATLNQYSDSAETAHRNLAGKLAAGASYVQTQPVLAMDALRTRAEAIKEASPETRIVAMAMPLLTADSLRRIEQRLRVPCPPEVEDRIASGEDAAWEFFGDILAQLHASPAVDGVAIMTFETDPPAETGQRVQDALRRAAITPVPGTT